MSTIINDLYLNGIEVIVLKDGDSYAVDVKYIKDNGKYEDGEYLDGYTGLTSQEDAEFLARAWINGFRLGKKHD